MDAERQAHAGVVPAQGEGSPAPTAAAAVVYGPANKPQVPQHALPLSPPLTDVSAAASTDSSPATISTPQMPAGTPPMSPGASSTQGIVTSPLPPFPAEVFSNVLSFLSQKDAASLCRVSRSWNHHISNDARLWSTLVAYLDADDDAMCQAVCLRAGTTGGGIKGGGGIRLLRLVLRSVRDRQGRHVSALPADWLAERTRWILDLVAQASVSVPAAAHGPSAAAALPRPCSSLRTLDVELYPNTQASLYVLDVVGQLSLEPTFCNLRKARFIVAAPGLYLSGAFLKMFPTVTTFEFKALPPSLTIAPVDDRSWVWENPLEQAVTSLDHLETLRLSHVYLGDEIDLPRLPSLKRLELRNSTWEGRAIFLLLRLARRTLEYICVERVEFEPAHDQAEDWLEHVHVTDPSLVEPGDLVTTGLARPWADAVPILLPVLRQLEVYGPSPPFFATFETADTSSSYDDDYYSSPVLCMPALDRCVVDAVDVESLFEEDALGALAVLGRNAPLVTHLELQSLDVSDWQLHCCLASMAAKVTTLDLYQSSITDWLVVRLPSLVPSLKVLDVRCCDGVSPQGVARMVEVIRNINDEGQSKVEKVYVDPPTSDKALPAYEWLDFVGVLERNEDDFEGHGPVHDVKQWRKWVKEGKKDEAWEHKELLAKLAAVQREHDALERARSASLLVGGSGESSSRSGGGGGGGGGHVGASAAGPCVSFAPPRDGPASHSRSAFGSFNSSPIMPFGTAQPTSTPMRHQYQQYAVQPGRPQPPVVLSSHFLPSLPIHRHHQQQQQPWSPSLSSSAYEQAHTYSPTPRPSAPAPPGAFVPRVAPSLVPMPARRHMAVAAAADTRSETSSIEDADDLEGDYSFLDNADGGAAHLGVDFMRAQQDELQRMEAARDDEMRAQVRAVVQADRDARLEAAQEQERAREAREQDRRDEAQAAAVLVLARRQGFQPAQPVGQADAAAPQPQPQPTPPGGVVYQGFASDGDSSTEGDDDDMAALHGGPDEDGRDESFEALV